MGWCVTLLIVPLVSDKRGRKWIFAVSVVIMVSCMIAMTFMSSLTAVYVFMFIAGMAQSGKAMVGYVYGPELCTNAWKTIYGTTIITTDGAVALVIAIYFCWISHHYRWLIAIGCTYATYCIVVLLTYATESPLWQLASGRKAQAALTMQKILRANGQKSANADEILQSFDKIQTINTSETLDEATLVAASEGVSDSESEKSTMFFLR